MQEFQYCVPTKIIFGPGAEEQSGRAALEEGAKRVLALYGGGSAVRSGLVGRVQASLENAGIHVSVKGGVQPNPDISFAAETVSQYRNTSIQLVLAIGGGSVADTAKAVAIGLAGAEGEIESVFQKGRRPQGALPVGAVVTIAASGSEASPTAVLSDTETHEKLLCTDSRIVPRFAILNPELTYTTPPLQTACGVVDILMHTLERYLASQGRNETTDALAEGLLRTVLRYGCICLECPDNYEARSEILWCGSLSHNGLTGLGRECAFPLHALSHELTAAYGLPHGMSLAILWPAWARAVEETLAARFARLGRSVFGTAEADAAADARRCIASLTAYFSALALPASLSQSPAGLVPDQDLCRFAANCTRGGGILASPGSLDFEAVLEIYRAANTGLSSACGPF